MKPAPHPSQGITPQPLDWTEVVLALRYMRRGYDLHQTAKILGVRARDLDLSLWQSLGQGAFS